jgi:hypothetical protein
MVIDNFELLTHNNGFSVLRIGNVYKHYKLLVIKRFMTNYSSVQEV